MVFQVQLSIDRTESEVIVKLTADTSLFGTNSKIDQILITFQETLNELLQIENINGELTYKRNFDIKTIKHVVLFKLDHGCSGPSPNIVILEPRINPNSDKEILHATEIYGLLSLASHLGAAVEIAINIYIESKNISFFKIMDGKNDTHICLKIWYLYYRWAGIWKVYKMGIRVGNFGIQKDFLAAAEPLFASAAKSNYTTAIAHYLSIIAAHPQLEEKLHYVGSFKILHEKNEDSNSYHTCFGFDKALETFGAKYVKQNITGNTIDEKSLRNQIKAC
ncbi:hypothetical protein RclHR1_15870002 [Rhizophagus clarus]|uniref:Uncharacterized protein n=1 Tax=Rhizophagus clarus TaxID=94130 RepID=A0A2Z6QHT8_9GLOM|nr:hypothetical protein RclHR1_15870002 [Rhizophagus clarus]